MSIYGKSGTSLTSAYGKSGTSLSSAYNVNGTEVFSSGDEGRRDWSGITAQFKANIDNAISYIQSEKATHSSAYAFPVFTDVHLYFAWNEPNYVAYNHPTMFPVFLFLGDITNLYDNTQLNDAVYYMEGAYLQNNLVGLGNHEWGNYDTESQDPYPKEWYIPLLPESCVFLQDDGLIYYYDDANTNTRYIMLDSNSSVKKASGTQKFNMNVLNWLASVMEDADDMDIIVLNHAMGSGFYLVTDTEQTDWKSDTTVTNIGTFHNIVNAYINKTTINVTVDGVSNSHDFSNTTGNFIAYITGHYHNAGFYDGVGFNKITCPAIIRNKVAGRGMSFFIVYPDLKVIKYIVCRTSENDQIEIYTYNYGVSE